MAENQIENLYRDISQRKVILFLGAGSSVNDSKKYLSKQLLDYYRDIKNIDFLPENNDIVEFVDKVFTLEEFDRNDFDLNISRWIKKNVQAQDFHKAAVSLPWLSILSTNIDLIVENSVEQLNYEDKFEFIRNYGEYVKALNQGDKCKVIKMHGCISDISKYPLLFSTNDFERNYKFYKKIFNMLKSMSNNVKILFVGYSFSDRFGSLFLNLFRKELGNREIYLLNPHIDESDFNLKYLKANNILPIKNSFEDFLKDYQLWADKNSSLVRESHKNGFSELNGEKISWDLQRKISPFLLPLNELYNSDDISEKEFYLGTEPTYSIIKKNIDIIKEVKITQISNQIENIFEEKVTSYPFVFLTGSYGSGKSTFSYRLLNYLSSKNKDLLVFEISDFEKLSGNEIVNFINKLKITKKIIFYSDQSEQDLNFKKLRELRGVLSSNQFEDKSIILLQSIRENILEIYKKKYNPDIAEINIDCAFTDKELEGFLERLNKNNLLTYRSAKEKLHLIEDLKKESLIYDQLSLSLYLLKKSNHYKIILDTYKSFNNTNSKKAFLYTSLLYQFGIKMPLSLLNSIIDTDWNTFINDVLKIDGKGIFIQETIKPDFYLKSDIYFKIKHKIVAESFIKHFVKDSEIFKHYQILISSLPETEESIYVFINLIKHIQNDKILEYDKIARLFDIAYKKLQDFPRFSIYYSRNLQNRGGENNLEKALQILNDAEEINFNLYNQRDRLIIHRKGVINFQLSRIFFKDGRYELAREYFEEARDLFDVKHIIDPISVFSYIDFIRMLIWSLTAWDLDIVERTIIENKLKFIINKGLLNVTDGISELTKYKDFLEKKINFKEMQERAEILYDKVETRPLALLIKIELEKNNENFLDLISEMETLKYDDGIKLYLFNYYGANLQYLNYRMKFFDLVRKDKFYEEKEDLLNLYYHFIAESYSYKFGSAFNYQRLIRQDYKNAYTKYPFFWKETDNEEIKVFTGKINKNPRGFNEIKILETGYKLIAKINNKEFPDLKDQETYNVNLYFTYTGIWATVVNKEL